MDYKKLYEQAQEEIARLKANDEESLRLTMAQNERFMDEIAQLKDEVIEERKKTIEANEKSQLNDMCRSLEADYCDPAHILAKTWDEIDGPREFMEHIREVCGEKDIHGGFTAQDYFDHFDLDEHLAESKLNGEDWGATTDEE